MASSKTIKFPENFLWGTATSAHQTEGNNRHSDWWAWENKKENQEKSGIACDHYRRYREDIKLIKNVLHNNAYRFSVEWAKIEPAEGKFNSKVLGHYRDVLIELRKSGIKSMLTLHHFVNPLWFSQKGGWLPKGNLKYFERYVRICAEYFGDLVDFWATINEPGVYASQAYLWGKWPPEKSNVYQSYKVFSNLAEAHCIAYLKIHSLLPGARVLPVLSVNSFVADGFFKKILADIFYIFVNHWFMKLIRGNYDLIGINYYGPFETGPIKFSGGIKAISSIGWKIYPKGIYEVLTDFRKKYNKPIFITENGNADADDAKRRRYIYEHLYWIGKAIGRGADVRGYFYWTLMDNFEWHLGRSVRFGLFETNYETLGRIPRKSAYMYGEISGTNSINANLLLKWMNA